MRPSWTRIGVLTVALAAACASGEDFDPRSLVNSVRVLAISLDSPYALPGSSVTADILAVDGRSQQDVPMTVYWFPSLCVNPDSDAYANCYEDMRAHYGEGDLTSQLVTSTRFEATLPEDIIETHVGDRGNEPYGIAFLFAIACAGHVEALPPADGFGVASNAFGCFDDGGNALGPESYVLAFATIYAFRDRVNGIPLIDHLTLDGAPIDLSSGVTLAPCAEADIEDCPEHTLDVVMDAAAEERDPGNLAPDGSVRNEQVIVNYYLTAGEVEDDTITVIDPRSGVLDDTSNVLFAPQRAGDYLFWAVVHDNRSGSSWLSFPLHAQ